MSHPIFTFLGPGLLATFSLGCPAVETAPPPGVEEAREGAGSREGTPEAGTPEAGTPEAGPSELDAAEAGQGLHPEASVDSPETQDPEPEPDPGFDHGHLTWNGILAEHVHGDRFDYRALKADREGLEAYLVTLSTVTPKDLAAFTEKQRYAFWMNSYNAWCIYLITEHYPLESINDIGGTVMNRVWDHEFITMEPLHPDGKDEKLSLNDIEHAILRPRFKDARVHAAINCASISCPPLRAEAFVAERLDEQLDEQVRLWLADTDRNQFDAKNRRIRGSAIFEWFKDDFVRDAESVAGWIERYAPEDQRAWIRKAGKGVSISSLDYDWGLNEVPPKKDDR